MSDLPLSSEQAEATDQYSRTTVLWSAILVARGQDLTCVIESIGPKGALIHINERFDFGSKAVVRNDRFGDLACEILWHEDYELEVRFKDDPEVLAQVLADYLP
ncbi:MAG: hypothetical protein AAF530_08725 [Pseudomonadota bacterium]